MIERQGLLDFPQEFDGKTLRVVTTNGIVKANGELVMGAGIALASKQRYPVLPTILGKLVKNKGNHVYVIPEFQIASFPTKHDWKDKSDLSLIEQSCQELVAATTTWDIVLMPRPGTNNGGLSWNNVKPILEKHLTSNKFVVMTG